jgi:hypothetical protein
VKITSCQAQDAKRKGKVELPFRQPRATFVPELELDGVPTDLADLNARARVWLDQRVLTVPSWAAGVPPAERAANEREFQAPLPRVRFDTNYVETRRVHYLQMTRAAERFSTLADDANIHDWTHIEFLAGLLAEETDATRNRRLAARLRYARFPFRRTTDDIDFEFQPSVDCKLIEDLATLRFRGEPARARLGPARLRQDPPGCRPGHPGVEAGWRGYFSTGDDMCRHLVAASMGGPGNRPDARGGPSWPAHGWRPR